MITPLVNAAGGGKSVGLGVHINGQLLNFGAFISAIIYFIIFVAVVYFLIVVPYRIYQARRGVMVFGDVPLKVCPECRSDDIPAEATRCKHCGIPLAAGAV